MRVEVILSPGEFERHDLSGQTAIVIDVFRFITTVLTALEAGLERFYPVADLEDAWALKAGNPNYLLAGERQALPIPGFDFGNSPLEHYGQRYAGGELVCSTTNGTRAIHAAKDAAEVVLACLRSADAVAKYVRELGRDVAILPAGLGGTYSLEDTWCAGLIIHSLEAAELGDGAKTALLVYEGIKCDELANTVHGMRLQSLGLHDDLDFCLETNRSSGVVIWDPTTGWGALTR